MAQSLISQLCLENDKLKAENERLMKQFDIEKLTNKKTGLSIYRSNKELMFREFEQNVSKKLIKYLNTLQEIKEIASNQDLYRGRQALATKILQKISDCEGTDE